MPQDPLRYFRMEARELLASLQQGLLRLEDRPDAETVSDLLRYAHSLKGAARVVKQLETAETAHRLESALAPFRTAPEGLTDAAFKALWPLVDDLGRGIQALDGAPAASAVASPQNTAAGEGDITVRLTVRDLDTLLGDMGEIAIRISQCSRLAGQLANTHRDAEGLLRRLRVPAAAGVTGPPADVTSRVETLQAELGHLQQQLRQELDGAERELGSAQERVNAMRLIPAGTTFALLERSVRDVAREQGKQIRFVTAGGDISLDSHVLQALQEALLHVVRNAAGHGIAPPAERARLGQPAEGTIRLTVHRDRQRVVFTCQDDGQGIDPTAIKAAAISQDLLGSDADLSDEAVLGHLIFQPGLTTASRLTEVSGRGIGLDVVQNVTARLKGRLRLESRPGAGTTVTISVPASLTSLSMLQVGTDDQVVALPLDAVERLVHPSKGGWLEQGGHHGLCAGDRVLPYAHLATLLRPGRTPPAGTTALILVTAAGPVALGIDRLIGPKDTVIRPLPGLSGAQPLVYATWLDTQGRPKLVLDPDRLGNAIRQAPTAGLQPGPRPKPTILVVDDSLTTRMLERNILESAGYPVDTAASGEEGLAKLHQHRYGLVLVDVEMPGIDGFAFIEALRQDPALQEVPAILVTSRASPEDQARGQAAGAQAYVVKSEFDQAALLRLIDQWGR